MSVINQMLKDLDKRQKSTAANTQSAVAGTVVNKSLFFPVVITVIVTLAIVATAYLFYENKALKQQSQIIAQQPSKEHKDMPTTRSLELKEETAYTSSVIGASTASESGRLEKIETNVNVSDVEPITALVSTAKEKQSSTQVLSASPRITQTIQVSTTQASEDKQKNNKVALSADLDNQLESNVNEIEVPISSNRPSHVRPVAQKTALLSIARKKLSPAALAEKKMAQAKQAMLNKNIALAEQYFEEILIISPSHASARKQLAALLYGRQSTQEAVNILSQGIHLSPDNSELRLMLARVYSEKGFNQQALNTLTPLADTLDVAYQSAIATSAQLLSAHQAAIHAFSHLIKLQQGQSRWQLGLAVSYDRTGQYPQAVAAYQQAIIIGNLSESALTFAKQRTLELGES